MHQLNVVRAIMVRDQGNSNYNGNEGSNSEADLCNLLIICWECRGEAKADVKGFKVGSRISSGTTNNHREIKARAIYRTQDELHIECVQ